MMKMTGLMLAAAIAAWGGERLTAGTIPRPEHPRPQFERADWVNLNGDMWTYTLDFDDKGVPLNSPFAGSKGFDRRIVVPFCPESKLSGVEHTDFIHSMWYHRKLEIPAAWKGRKVLLHFGGVDYESHFYLDGKEVAFHFGGTSSFTVDLTAYATCGKTHDLVIRIVDMMENQPYGKQSKALFSRGCSYTRVTGIWQTVWLEAVDPAGLADCTIAPDLDNGRFVFTPAFFGETQPAATFRAIVRHADGREAGRAEAKAASGVAVAAPVDKVRAWSPEDPYLYDVTFEVLAADGKVLDTVRSYAGLRKVSVTDGKIYLNNKPRYLRFVLDQGYYPDGIWTAPSDAALKKDIEMSMAVGFNGARLHQKVFEERFHYWADKLGYLTWAESSSWGLDVANVVSARNFLPEWREIVVRDRNHPSIIAWTPFNETWGPRDGYPPAALVQHQRFQNDIYELTKALDPTRPVNTASGDLHSKTDIWAVHDYGCGSALLKNHTLPEGQVYAMRSNWVDVVYHRYQGQPYLIDEIGGTRWTPAERLKAGDNSWGYGKRPEDAKAFFAAVKDKVDGVLALPRVVGYCYTQLTDVEQEQNGVYFYERTDKFDVESFRAIFGRDPEGWGK